MHKAKPKTQNGLQKTTIPTAAKATYQRILKAAIRRGRAGSATRATERRIHAAETRTNTLVLLPPEAEGGGPVAEFTPYKIDYVGGHCLAL